MTPDRATFREARADHRGVRRFVLDCPHGQTTGELVGDAVTAGDVLEALVARHTAAEGCSCASQLRPTVSEARA